MKHIFVTGLLLSLLFALGGCSNLINDMSNQYGTAPDSTPTGSKDGPSTEDLTLEETASLLDDFLSLQINDLHIPALSALSKLYRKIGEEEMAESYSQKIDVILRRLWDKKTEFEIRKQLEL